MAHSVALLLIALLSMTPEGTAEMLSGISKSRRAVICLMEKLCMPKKLCADVSYDVIGYGFRVINQHYILNVSLNRNSQETMLLS